MRTAFCVESNATWPYFYIEREISLNSIIVWKSDKPPSSSLQILLQATRRCISFPGVGVILLVTGCQELLVTSHLGAYNHLRLQARRTLDYLCRSHPFFSTSKQGCPWLRKLGRNLTKASRKLLRWRRGPAKIIPFVSDLCTHISIATLCVANHIAQTLSYSLFTSLAYIFVKVWK